MSDNVQPLFGAQPPKKQRGKRHWGLFLAILLLVLVLLVVYLLTCTTTLDRLKRYVRYLGDDVHSITFDAQGTTCFLPVNDGLAVASQSGLTLFDSDGSVLAQLEAAFSAPALEAVNGRLLLHDIGGTFFCVLTSEGKLLHELTAGGVIYDAALSASGGCAVLCAGTDSRAVLELYDKNGALLYRRSTKAHYLNTCALSPDGTLAAVSTLGQDGLEFCSSVQLLHTDSDAIAAENDLGTELVYDLAFLDANTLCAVCENSLCFFDTSGTQLGKYAEPDGALADFCIGSGRVRAVYECYSGPYVLAAPEGNRTVALSGAPLHLSICGSYTAVLTEAELCIYDDALNLLNQTENTGFSHAFVRADGSALCIADGSAKLYIP